MPSTTPNFGLTVYADGDTAETFFNFRKNVAGDALTSNMQIIDSALADVTAVGDNLIINGGLSINQRHYSTPMYKASVANDEYFIDRWYLLKSGASANIWAAGKSFQSMSNPANASAFQTLQSSSGSVAFAFAQIIEGVECSPTKGTPVTFTIDLCLKSSEAAYVASIPVGIYIIEVATGTADSVTSDFISDWSTRADPGGPTLLANYNVIASAQAQNVLDSTWTQFTITGTPTSNCRNLIVYVITEGTMAVDQELGFTKAGLYISSVAPAWHPRPQTQEYALCQRFYETNSPTINMDSTAWTTAFGVKYVIAMSTILAGEYYLTYFFKTPKRGTGGTLKILGATSKSQTIISDGFSSNDFPAGSGTSDDIDVNHFVLYNGTASSISVPDRTIKFLMTYDIEL